MEDLRQHSNQELKSVLERGAASYLLSNTVTKVIALSNTFLVLSSLTPYAYGVVELALSVVIALSVFQLPGLERTVISDMGIEKGAARGGTARRVFNDFILLQSLLCAIAWALLFFGSELVGRFFTEEIGSYFTILSFLFLAVPCAAATRILLSVYFDFSTTAAFTFLQEGTKLIFLVGLWVGGDITIAGVLWSYVFAQFASVLLLMPRTWRWMRALSTHPVTGGIAVHRFFLGHNFWTLTSNYLDASTKSVRLWLIKLMLGTESVALFAVAQGVVGQLSSFVQISSVVTPVLPQYEKNRPIFFRIIDKTIKYQFLSACVVIIFGLITVPVLIKILFPHYVVSLPLFYMTIFVLIPSSISSVFQTMFYVLRAQRNLFLSQFFRLGLVLGFGTIFMSLFGVAGIAMEYIGTAIVFGFERYRSLKKMYPDFRIQAKDFVSYDEYDRLLIRRLLSRLNGFIGLR